MRSAGIIGYYNYTYTGNCNNRRRYSEYIYIVEKLNKPARARLGCVARGGDKGLKSFIAQSF